jgi:hypothetical protein
MIPSAKDLSPPKQAPFCENTQTTRGIAGFIIRPEPVFCQFQAEPDIEDSLTGRNANDGQSHLPCVYINFKAVSLNPKLN